MANEQMPMNGKFDMGRVVKATFGSIQRHFIVLLAGAAVFGAFPQALNFVALRGVDTTNPTGMFTSPMYWLALFAALAGGFLLQGYVINTVVTGHRGEKPSIAQSFAVAFSKALPLLILAIVLSFGMMLGFILLIVPGIILAIMWSVATPALVVEGLGPIQALGRSRALTKGSRWPIFGLAIVVFLLSYIISLAIFGFNFAAMSTASLSPSVPQIIGSVLVGLINGILFSAGGAAIYSELRLIKEGVQNTQLVAAFD